MTYNNKNDWEYSNLTAEAKKYGGPEAFKKRLVEIGMLEGVAIMATVRLVRPLVARGVSNVVNFVQRKLNKANYDERIAVELTTVDTDSKQDKDSDEKLGEYTLVVDGMTIEELDQVISTKYSEFNELELGDPMYETLLEEWGKLVMKREKLRLALEHLKSNETNSKENFDI